MKNEAKTIKLKINILGLMIAGFMAILNQNFVLTTNNGLEVGNFGDYFIPHAEKEIKLIAVGDIMLSREVDRKMAGKNDYRYPFLETYKLTSGADIAFGNLENPIISGKTVKNEEMIFRADPKAIEGLKFAGFDVLNLANNHIMNFGKPGLENTIKILDENGISHMGAGLNEVEIHKPVMEIVRGVKIAFLGYTYDMSEQKTSAGEIYGAAHIDIEQMKKDVAEAKKEADIVIVSMHAGTEYEISPDNFQKEFAHAAVEAGASLVIGHHPHVVQTVEKYEGKYIIYSLGNFIFDQMWSDETRLGVTAEITFENNDVSKLEFMPVKIYDYAQPRILSGQEADEALGRMGLKSLEP